MSIIEIKIHQITTKPKEASWNKANTDEFQDPSTKSIRTPIHLWLYSQCGPDRQKTVWGHKPFPPFYNFWPAWATVVTNFQNKSAILWILKENGRLLGAAAGWGARLAVWAHGCGRCSSCACPRPGHGSPVHDGVGGRRGHVRSAPCTSEPEMSDCQRKYQLISSRAPMLPYFIASRWIYITSRENLGTACRSLKVLGDYPHPHSPDGHDGLTFHKLQC